MDKMLILIVIMAFSKLLILNSN